MSILKRIPALAICLAFAACLLPATAFAAAWANPNFSESNGVVTWDNPGSAKFTLQVTNKNHSEIWFNATPGGAQVESSFDIEGFLDGMAAPDGTYVLRVWPQNGYDYENYDYAYSSPKGTLATPQNPGWNGYVMTWDPIDNAVVYRLNVYKNNTLVYSTSTNAPAAEKPIATSYFANGDKVTFSVRAENSAAGYGSSYWSTSGEMTYGSVSEVTLSFDANGGSGTMDSRTGAPGTIVFGGSQCNFTAPEGKEFDCWECPDGQKLQGNESLTVYGDTELKALWKDASNPGDGNDAPGGGAAPEDGNDTPGGTTPEGSNNQSGNDAPNDGDQGDKVVEPESGDQAEKPAAGGVDKPKDAIAQTGDATPFVALTALAAAAGAAVLALRRKLV